MASLRDIRRRITSVEKTQQITRAMRMVAAAKLRRAQDAIEAARPYALRMRSTLEEISRSSQGEIDHPLLQPREEVKRVEVVVVASDRGLCGGFNANIDKCVSHLEREQTGRELEFTVVGRKALEAARRHGRRIRERYVGLGTVAHAHAVEIAKPLMERYAAGETDEVILVFSEFVSAVSQRPQAARLLPFTAAGEQPAAGEASAAPASPFTIEPSPAKLLAVLVPKAVEVEVYRALLENQAGEHAARMAAMESATRNSEEMIDSLTLTYNRARQAAITKELVEIVSGAEAL